MLQVKKLNQLGLVQYVQQMERIKGTKGKEEQLTLITELVAIASANQFTHSFSKDKTFEIDPTKTFTTRLDMAVYFEDVFGDEFIPNQVYNWLSVVYFLQLIKEESKSFKVGRTDRYYTKRKRSYRHLPPYIHFAYRTYGELARPLILDDSLVKFGDFEEVMFSFKLVRNSESILKLMNRLYIDDNSEMKKGFRVHLPTERPKRKGSSYKKKISGIRALKRFLMQLKETRNMDLITADELYDLLPPQFDYFKNN